MPRYCHVVFGLQAWNCIVGSISWWQWKVTCTSPTYPFTCKGKLTHLPRQQSIAYWLVQVIYSPVNGNSEQWFCTCYFLYNHWEKTTENINQIWTIMFCLLNFVLWNKSPWKECAYTKLAYRFLLDVFVDQQTKNYSLLFCIKKMKYIRLLPARLASSDLFYAHKIKILLKLYQS